MFTTLQPFHSRKATCPLPLDTFGTRQNILRHSHFYRLSTHKQRGKTSKPTSTTLHSRSLTPAIGRNVQISQIPSTSGQLQILVKMRPTILVPKLMMLCQQTGLQLCRRSTIIPLHIILVHQHCLYRLSSLLSIRYGALACRG